MDANQTCWGLLRRRSCPVPTWLGGLVLGLGLALLSAIGWRGVYPFLAVNRPNPRGVLVIEASAQENMLAECLAEFKRHHYDKVLVTGGPLEQGGPLAPHKNEADLCVAALRDLGMSADVLEAVSEADPRQDRTYACAVALRHQWRARGTACADVNLLASGAHARRCRLLFQRALGPGVRVGVVAVRPADYDARHWWRSSQGFRTVTAELIAYGYARLLFWKFPRA